MKNDKLSRIRAAIYGQPWAITPEWLETICSIFEAHVAGHATQPFVKKEKCRSRCPDCKSGIMGAVIKSEKQNADVLADYTCPNCGCECTDDELPPYEIVNGVAILQLAGPLIPKANWISEISGATSYDQFGSDFSDALEDPDVQSILIEADSPGGSCLRLSELCSRIYVARELGSKPIFGLVDPMAASAAYAIISQCDRVYITESGLSGSIGVVSRYDNWERAERNEGNDPVMMASSDVKAFGQPESVAQYQSIMERVAAYFEQFKEIVARGREKIDLNAVATGKVWVGRDAVKVGIVDGVSTMEQVLSELSGA